MPRCKERRRLSCIARSRTASCASSVNRSSPIARPIALYRDAQAVLAFERNGKLRLQLSDADGIVLKGTSVMVTAEAEGGKATFVRLRWQTPKGTHWLVMRPVGDNRFVAQLVVTESGKLQAVCGCIKSPSVSLLAVLPPRIGEWLVSVEPPDYAGLPAESFAEPPLRLRLLKGTKVTVTATASSVLSAAQLLCEPTTSADVATDGRQVTIRFTVRQPFRWRLRLRDRYGFEGLTSWQRVEVQPDDPPKVAVLTGVKAVVAGGFAPLTVRAEDDFGVRQLAFAVRCRRTAPTSFPLANHPLAHPDRHDSGAIVGVARARCGCRQGAMVAWQSGRQRCRVWSESGSFSVA